VRNSHIVFFRKAFFPSREGLEGETRQPQRNDLADVPVKYHAASGRDAAAVDERVDDRRNVRGSVPFFFSRTFTATCYQKGVYLPSTTCDRLTVLLSAVLQ